MPRVEVIVDEVIDGDVPADLIARAAEQALAREHTSGPDRITILLTNDETLRELNRRFMGEDSVTDVLSFNQTAGWSDGVPPDSADLFPANAEGGSRLGDIAISLPQAERQAAEKHKDTRRELAMLTVHGVLHLLGYEHAGPGEEAVMFGKTDEVLALLFAE